MSLREDIEKIKKEKTTEGHKKTATDCDLYDKTVSECCDEWDDESLSESDRFENWSREELIERIIQLEKEQEGE